VWPENHETVKDHLSHAGQPFSVPKGIFGPPLARRSPKDAFYWGCGLAKAFSCQTARSPRRMAFDLLTCCSERIYDDLTCRSP